MFFKGILPRGNDETCLQKDVQDIHVRSQQEHRDKPSGRTEQPVVMLQDKLASEHRQHQAAEQVLKQQLIQSQEQVAALQAEAAILRQGESRMQPAN